MTNIKVKKQDRVYNGFFKMDQITFDQNKFDGTEMKDIKREVFIRKPVVFLSLYDPKEDTHLFIMQVRAGAIVNDLSNPIVLEPIAGIIDEGETPILAAIREAKEEAGIDLYMNSISIIQEGYTSPGGSSEYAYFATGLFDSSNYKEKIGGMPDEHEDILSRLISTKDALLMVKSGEINSLSGSFGLYWHIVHSKKIL